MSYIEREKRIPLFQLGTFFYLDAFNNDFYVQIAKHFSKYKETKIGVASLAQSVSKI